MVALGCGDQQEPFLKNGAAIEHVDLQRATEVAQQYAGAYKCVVHCELPYGVGLYVIDARVLSPAVSFIFAVSDRQAHHVGGTDYLAVSRETGATMELGRLGE